MLQRIRKSRWTKVVALGLVISLFTELIAPLRLYAISGGPSQPEFAGFTPLNTGNMVDLFSGDFHYTIPIMTVPGPNGGFPINLNYTSGVGMEHEASWVGLGWNLNPGAINRQVRGIPDDFKNDTIVKIYHRRDNNTFLFSLSGGGEFYGGDFGLGINQSNSFIYNTYNGISLSRRFGISASYVRSSEVERFREKIKTHTSYAQMGFNVSQDSENGITTSFSMNGGKYLKGGFHYGYNSKSGTYTYGNQVSLSFPVPMDVTRTKNNETETTTESLSIGAGGVGRSFSTAASLPPFRIPMNNTSWGVSFQAGGAGAFAEGYGGVNCNVISQTTPIAPVINPACGILYADKADENSLQDFNREKEICVDHDSRNLPLPIMTNDLYNITGELMGGSFRAYRSDYGHFYDNRIENNTFTTDAGVDLSFGNGTQLGTNLSFTYGESETGDWGTVDYDTLLTFKDKGTYNNQSPKSIHPTLYEPFYFKMQGEQTAADINLMSGIGNEKAVSFMIKHSPKNSFWGGKDYRYYTNDTLSSGIISRHEQPSRTLRATSIEYDTKGTGPERKDHHIAQFSILNANGERFTYGKALYNFKEKEVSFSIPSDSLWKDSTVICSYDSILAKSSTLSSQRVGKEKLYTSTTTPAYPYSYLLTSITSPDYIDLTGNGPSNDDLGYWVKLGYSVKSTYDTPYCWRFPYQGANYFMGDRSNLNDDIGSYYYGEKEIAYVDTISTKTHYAVFYVSLREDARGVNPANEQKGGFSGNSRHLFKLDSIKLFSKEDPSVAIKTAVFEYDYSLCKGLPNSVSSTHGKLTLKRLYFKYANSLKGMQNPYVFHYSNCNPYYAPEKMDRWGNYKGDANYFEHYVTQDPDSTNKWASAWLLTEIDLPEGGRITIEHESDDYAYVQDRQAMYMAEVDPLNSFEKENGKYYIYFKKKPNIDAAEYVSGFKHDLMYFKIAARYAPNKAPDYIQGYVKVKTAVNHSLYVGKIEVEAFPVFDIHPVYFFALQYLKNNRPDLMFDGADEYENSSDAAAFFRALVSGGVIDKAKAMNGNNEFYRNCKAEGNYRRMAIGQPGMPSYVRLNVPDKIKYGGGSRVKSITLHDGWTKSDGSSYKQEYYYRKTENGKLISSGVAEYEPTVGAEENAMRYPVYDEVKGLFFIEDEIYSEEPYGESYFPGANVGYSQVIVKTYTPENVTLSTAGIQRFEFYTAKDFPISVSQTDLECMVDPVPNVLQLITSGFKQASSSCYSQGYLIELNDMHGKKKAISTCPFVKGTVNDSLVANVEQMGYTSQVQYHYKTKIENGIEKLDNVVEVLLADGRTERMVLGQTYDFVIDQRRNHSKSIGGGANAQFMLGNVAPPIAGVSAFPTFDCFEEDVKSVATTKIIYRTGILEKTRAYNNGSVITTTNLQYDPYTGKPLLTTVTNEFEQPVYHYSMPAYWYYPNMGSAANNYKATYYEQTSLPNGQNTFSQFDLIEMNESDYRIDSFLSGSHVQCWTATGSTPIALSGKEIIRSRNANCLNEVTATIAALRNPASLSNRRLPVLEDFNSQGDECYPVHDCQGNIRYARVVYMPATKELYFFVGDDWEKLCEMDWKELLDNYNYVLCKPVKLPEGLPLAACVFRKEGSNIAVYQRRLENRPIASFEWNDPKGIFPECMDGVLQASATEFKSGWTYNYDDVNMDNVSNSEYLGIPNIYRNLRANLYVTERNQTGSHNQYATNVAYDGTFASFSPFYYGRGNEGNMQKPWAWTAEITKYSPFNFEIENVNALGIYSSALYGYKNSLVTAVANNARYDEIGFDSFENDQNIPVGGQRGHMVCTTTNDRIDSGYAHSGKKSLLTSKLSINISGSSKLNLQPGKKYILSCWVRKEDCLTLGNLGDDYNFTYGDTIISVTKEPKVECWQRIEVEFTYKNTADLLELTLLPSGMFYVDDIRIMPSNAIGKTYVYSPQNYRLLAELDENNFATFYNYDEEGVLVQIKKETEKGIMMVKTTRQHYRVHPTQPDIP